MDNRVYKIILADDHEILLDSLEKLIKPEKDLTVIAKVNNGHELINRVEISSPDLCIVDMDMPIMNGMISSENLLKKYPGLKIMILSMHSEKSIIKKMVRMGIKGYLTKTCDQDEFLFAIRQVLKGKSYFSNDVLESVAKEEILPEESDDLQKISLLSDREREILKLVCEGLINKQIAEQLFLSPKTVDNHRTSIMKKLEVHNVVELIRFCLKNSLI
ncbi:MAG: response regulator transcription factor [Bacteroidales bacterium]|nr:response regulator transcription factor [Bacteroidales bacterium]